MWELFFGVFGFHAVWACLNPKFNTPFRVIFWQGGKYVYEGTPMSGDMAKYGWTKSEPIRTL